MVPSTSANRRRLKAATRRFWAVTSSQRRPSSPGGPGALGRCWETGHGLGTSAMACLAPSLPGQVALIALFLPPPASPQSPSSPPYPECDSRIRHPHAKE